MRNLLVMYKGGGYDGCFWEWNFCFWDSEGEWHDLYSSGRDGIETEDEMLIALTEDDSNINYIVNITNEKDIAYWTKEFNASLVLRIAEILNDDYYYEIELPCKECGNLSEPEYMHYVDKYTLVCEDCYCSGGCVACNEFVGEDNLHCLPEDIYNEEGPVCEFCKDHFESEAIANDLKELQFTATLTGKPDIFSPEYEEVVSKIETQFETCFNDYRNKINH